MASERSLVAYRDEARRWLQAHLEPLRDDRPQSAFLRFEPSEAYLREQRSLQRVVYDGGYAGITWPEEYGGQGLSAAHQRIFHEEARRFAMPNFGTAAITTTTCSKVIRAHATEAFKRAHLPRVFAGEELWAQLLSEPAAGSDLAGIRTRADRDGDGWRLHGAKVWSSYAHLADWALCIARTDPDVPKHRGLTWFAIPTSAPGLSIRPIRQITGASEFCEEELDGVVVPDGDRIGDVDDGWTVATTLLTFERGGDRETPLEGAVRRGDGPGPLAPDLVALATAAGRAGDPIARQLLAEAHTNDFALGELGARVAELTAAGAPASAAHLKLARGTYEPRRAAIAMEIGRGAAIAWTDDGSPGQEAAAGYLAGRLMAIAAGTNEIQRNVIAERILGLPREPSFDRDRPFREVLRRAERWRDEHG